ncbi:hypothetical protein Pla110_30910 [Polystyrenella longa]|uniref:Two component regulator propeller n=1 Tax=Polystyrenella longa TaxID=2528007 RepID=A0A518CQ47_9PLAN|nr:hypothetical protein [Polystyrenella longa]QDU81350.1 hypothetical protein Pla110_30910 [Polystyrenella longa]
MKRHSLNKGFSWLVLAGLVIGTTLATIEPLQAKPPIRGTGKGEVVGEYLQQVAVQYTKEEGLPSKDILCLAADNGIFAGTAKGIAQFEGSTWKTVLKTSSPVVALTTLGDTVFYATQTEIGQLGVDDKAIATIRDGVTITEMLLTPEGLYISSNEGLDLLPNGSSEQVEVKAFNDILPPETTVNQLAYSEGRGLAIASTNGLYLYSAKDNQAARIHAATAAGGWFLADVRGVGFDSQGQLRVAAPQGIAFETQEGWDLLTGSEGLPYNDFTKLAVGSKDDVWYATHIGAVHRYDDIWEYRQGRRWILDDDIRDVVVTPNGYSWFATAKGVSCIKLVPMTLREKADFFNAEIEKYHLRTEYGYVDSVRMKEPGVKIVDNQKHDSDNDGLWTSMYGAAHAFEYAVTKTPESKARANKAFRAIGFLSEVPQGGKHSPPFGFPARTILPTSGRNPNDHDSVEHDKEKREKDPDHLWKVLDPRWPVSADGQWYWKTDTSSDELDGHYFFYGAYYDLVAETEEEKSYCREVVDRVSTHLIEHDYALVDHDGQPTRWGQFGPHMINTDKMTDLRGLNAISLLAYIKTAYHVTGDPKYQEHYEKLLYEHDYFTNVLHPKWQNGPGTGNQSDDEMAFMCYYNLFQYETDPKLIKQYTRSMNRYFLQEQYELCPLFNFIYALNYYSTRFYWPEAIGDEIIPEAIDSLKRYPLDRFRWSMKNSHRLDMVHVQKHVIRQRNRGYLYNGYALPIDERFVEHWNHDPWRMDVHGNGTELADGASFLLPYYMGVYHGYVIEDPSSASPTSGSASEE